MTDMAPGIAQPLAEKYCFLHGRVVVFAAHAGGAVFILMLEAPLTY